MTRKLVVYPALEPFRYERLLDAAGAVPVVNAPDRESALREMPGATAFFGKLTPDLLAAAKVLEWVQTPTASLEHYMFPELVEHPCRLSNMRGLFSDVIADHVFGYILSFARNLHIYLRQQAAHRWAPLGGEESRSDFLAGPGLLSAMDRAHQHLSDCTLGIVGVGEIGSEVARRARAFGMEVLGVDPRRRSLPGTLDDIWPVERLPDLLAASDYVVVAAPHTPETAGMFRRQQFESMRRTARFINVGRGAVVCLADLTDALTAGSIAGAALDVFEIEPLPADHPLWSMENVILTPHVAAASPRVSERHLETLLENVRRYVQGELPTTLVDKRLWY